MTIRPTTRIYDVRRKTPTCFGHICSHLQGSVVRSLCYKDLTTNI